MSNIKPQEVIIKIGNITKTFQLPHERSNSLKSKLTSMGGSNSNKGTTEKQKVLTDINLEIKDGEFFGIVGRNGSGKSTLLKIIAGIYQPSSGELVVNGRIVPFIELGVGFNPELTGRENTYLNGALLGFSRKEIKAKFQDILDFAELERFIDQKLKNYSSGMQVRLAFSIATRLAESDVLLIDEVLAVGDAKFQRKCFDYFSNLKKQKKTVIFVTHDMNAVRQYCDRATLIEASHQMLTGSPEEVATEYTKLFQKTNQAASSKAVGNRYGSKKQEFISVSTDKKVYKTEDTEIKIKCVIRANEHVVDQHVVYGISILNEAGQRLFGTNTTLLKIDVKNLDIKQRNTIEWTIPNILNEGDYDICPEIVLSNGEVCDSWQAAKKISVYSTTTTSFPVNPKISFKLSKKTDKQHEL